MILRLGDDRSTETTKQIKARFGSAFKRYSTQHTAMRRLKADVPEEDITAWIHSINAQSRMLSDAERDYKVVRLEYVKHLLSGPSAG
jgi:hypothetical protein